MLRRTAICLIIAGAGAVLAAPAGARERSHFRSTPFVHAPCNPLSGRPCTPSFCSVFQHGPCFPELPIPFGENLQVTVLTRPPQADAAKYQRPDHDLDTIADLFAALRACWSPPPERASREGMQMSVLFSFRKSGTMIAPPRLTFATQDASADIRKAYLQAITTSLDDCAPLR